MATSQSWGLTGLQDVSDAKWGLVHLHDAPCGGQRAVACVRLQHTCLCPAWHSPPPGCSHLLGGTAGEAYFGGEGVKEGLSQGLMGSDDRVLRQQPT